MLPGQGAIWPSGCDPSSPAHTRQPFRAPQPDMTGVQEFADSGGRREGRAHGEGGGSCSSPGPSGWAALSSRSPLQALTLGIWGPLPVHCSLRTGPPSGADHSLGFILGLCLETPPRPGSDQDVLLQPLAQSHSPDWRSTSVCPPQCEQMAPPPGWRGSRVTSISWPLSAQVNPRAATPPGGQH